MSLSWNFVLFDHLDMFRILDFEFFLLLILSATLALCASHSVLFAAQLCYL
jgi:hypothetical protein